MNACPHCGWKLSSPSSFCPNCGGSLHPQHEHGEPGRSSESQAPTHLITRYVNDLKLIITKPHTFFRTMPRSGGLSHPLAFALVTHWIGSAISFLWQAMIGGAFESRLRDLMNQIGGDEGINSLGRHAHWAELQHNVMNWFWGAGSVVADPFITLLSILFTSVLVFVGARILVPSATGTSEREVTFESALRIICYGMSPAIFAVVPLGGAFIAWLLTLYVTVVGAKEVYRITSGRALVVVLFPKLLFLGIIMSFVLMAVVGLVALFAWL